MRDPLQPVMWADVPVILRLAVLLPLAVSLLSVGCERRVGGSFSKRRGRREDADGAASPARHKLRAQKRSGPRPGGGIRRALVFSARWCPSCSRLHEQVLSAPVGRELFAGISLEIVDFDKAPDRVARHSVTGLPTTVFLDARGRERDRIEGFEGLGDYLAEARAILGGRDMLSLLQDGLRRRPQSLELHYRIGRKLLGRGREKEAMTHYDKVLAADPKNRTGLVGKILMHRARYLVRVKRDPTAAVAYLEEAVKRVAGGREGESLRYWLAHALCLAGRPAAAVKVVDEQVKLRGRKAAALILAAGLRRKCRGGYELEKALGQVREAVRKAPANDWAWYLLAALASRLGRKAEAKRAIARARELEPASPFYEGEARRMGLGR